jgi:hypothetical protein
MVFTTNVKHRIVFVLCAESLHIAVSEQQFINKPGIDIVFSGMKIVPVQSILVLSQD